MSGFFGVIDPEVMFELNAASIAALREQSPLCLCAHAHITHYTWSSMVESVH